MIRLVVGLGNPGTQYAKSRHNAGFLVLDRLAQEEKLSWKSWKDLGSVAVWDKRNLMKPSTFMNESGRAVREWAAYKNVQPQEVLLISDDLDLPLGALRIRPEGSSGGHRGLDSVISHLGTQDFPRIRIGIGRSSQDPKDHVLEDFKPDETEAVSQALQKALEAVRFLCAEDAEDLKPVLETAMNRFNQKGQAA